MAKIEPYTPELESIEKFVSGSHRGYIVTFKFYRQPDEVSLTIPVLVGFSVDEADIIPTARSFVARISQSLVAGTKDWLPDEAPTGYITAP